MKVIELKEEDFYKKIDNFKGKVLVDCYASWCGPCRMLAPILEEVALENNNFEFYKINIDEAPKVSSDYEIMSIPTILLFENNELKNRIVGFKTKDQLEELIKK